MARILLAALLLSSGMAQSHDQSDVITMYNGDKITGEIRGLDYGALRVKTPYANEFSLEWWQIASIESKYNFEIQTDEGERLYGNVSSSDTSGQLIFTSIEASAVIDLLKITELRPIEDTLADAFTYTLGASLNLEPQLATAQLKATVALATERTKNTGKLTLQESTTRLEKEGGKGYRRSDNPSRMMALDFEHQRWTNRRQFYRTFTGRFDYNESLNNYGRISVGTGLGKYFIDNAGLRFNASLGLQAIGEKNRYTEAVDIPPDSTNIDSRCFYNPTTEIIYEPNYELALEPENLPDKDELAQILDQLEIRECVSRYASSTSLETFASSEFVVYNLTEKDFDVRINTNLYPSITESGRFRADIGAEIAWEMVNDLFLTVSTTTQYDSGKPDDEVTRNEKLDYNIVMGVSWRP